MMGGISASAVQPIQNNNPALKVAIVTDSIAQVPEELVQELGIHVVPFSLSVEGKIYTDLVDLNLNSLYQRMRLEKNLQLTTSAPSIGKFQEVFEECYKSGAGNVLYVGISSQLSHAFSSAEEASRLMIEEHVIYPPIILFDSRLATAAQGFLAIEAARLAKKGANPRSIIEHLTSERERTGFAAGLETLEYLARGGRIGKAAYMLGSAIHILPVVSIDHKGLVIPVSRKQGYNRVLEEIIRYVKEKITGYHSLSLAVMHADSLHYAEMLKSMAMEQFHPDEIYITDFTPTMVAHSGPGIIGLAYHWRL